jgi:CO/xanthine dehydrogenase Mo-binding subunit
MRLTGMLYGKVLRSPHAHARIKSINTAKAEALPGVRAVITTRDIPQPEDKIANLGEMAVNVKYLSNNVLAGEKALYKGHAIAAVAATNAHIAEEALKLIEVEYEVLPATLNVLDAMKEEAPLLHDTMTTTEFGQKNG